MGKALWWVLALCIALILGLVVALGLVCSSLIGGASDQLGRTLDVARDELERSQEQTAIAQSEFESVRPRASRASVEADLGKPAATSARDSTESLPDEPPGTSCLYYNELDQPLFAGPTYRFCFRGRRLVAKDVL